jgi:hypothetical protein
VSCLQEGDPADPVGVARHLLHATGQFLVLGASEAGGLTFGSDNLGMRPLFVAEARDGFYISNHSSLTGKLVGSTRPDLRFARDLIVNDAVVPSLCMVADVRRIDRGESVLFDAESRRMIGTRAKDQLLDEGSREQALESLRAAARALKTTGRAHLLGLTGGRDSRLAMAAMMSEGVEFETATHGVPCADASAAKQLATLAGVAHHGIRRRTRGLYPSLAKFLKLLPWSDGSINLGMLEDAYTVHDLAADTGRIHLGGLGGEVARAYWDAAESAFQSSAEVIETRFFAPHKKVFYPQAADWQESQERWLDMLNIGWHGDPMVLPQIAYLDARLRGMLGLRTNLCLYDYAWILATPDLYRYALRLPRAERQSGAIFEDLIAALCPKLLSVPWAAGNAGIVHRSGWRGIVRQIKQRAKQSPTAHRIRGHLGGRKGADSLSDIVVREFLRDPDNCEWIRSWASPEALAAMQTGSPTYRAQTEKCVSVRLAHIALEAVADGADVTRRLWTQRWLQQVMACYPQ